MNERARWDRPTLKSYAKTSLKNYYWKAVLTTLIFLVLTGGEIFSVNFETDSMDRWIDGDASGLMAVILSGIVLLALILGLVYAIFVMNPLIVGHNRYYLDSRFAPTDVGRLFSGFTGGNYGNVVKTMFLHDLYLLGWSLLFIIPGIVKAYEYAMVPYLLAENPDMPSERAFALSKEMMRGRKWDLFVLELSFLGWSLLAVFVVIGNVFLQPYIKATNAEVYLWLRYDALCNGYAHPAELNGLFMEQPEYNTSC